MITELIYGVPISSLLQYCEYCKLNVKYKDKQWSGTDTNWYNQIPYPAMKTEREITNT